jgi:hypothetical protein
VAELINLNRARKAKARDEGQARAAENRVKFGRSKAETRLAKAQAEKARKDVDAGKRER